jgi:hypothetical protein
MVILDCGTTYHTDYSEKSQERTYYDGIPEVIQLATHHFVDVQLTKMWKLNMNMAHMSSGNCAATYLRTFLSECRTNFPANWGYKPSLNGRHVWDAFVILSLLQDCMRRSTHLIVPDGGSQSTRFTTASLERNERMRTEGQPQVEHSCSLCLRTYEATETERESLSS